MHRWACVSALVIGLTAGSMPTALAHSWYPHECCAQNDCAPADRIERGPRGITAVVVGNRRIEIPPGIVARSSPDHHVHVCFVSSIEAGVPWMALCLFVPGLA
jgi:hypothetical protein